MLHFIIFMASLFSYRYVLNVKSQHCGILWCLQPTSRSTLYVIIRPVWLYYPERVPCNSSWIVAPFYSPRCEHTQPKNQECSRPHLLNSMQATFTSRSLFQTFICKSNALVFHNTSASKRPDSLQLHRPAWSVRGFSKSLSPPGIVFLFPWLDIGPNRERNPHKITSDCDLLV